MENTITNPFKVGDILCAMWSYTMFYPLYYQVISVAPKSIVVRELEKKMVDGDGWQGHEIPVKDSFCKYEKARRMMVRQNEDGRCYVDPDPSSYAMGLATIWDGQPKWADHMD